MRRTVVTVLGVLLAACFITGVVEAFHNFVWFGARSKQAEARSNLKRLCQSQRALLAAGTPASTWRALGENIERGNRYAYFVAPGGRLESRPADHSPVVPDPEATGVQTDPRMGPPMVMSERDVPAAVLGGLHLGANGTCPRCAWVMVALGNVDADLEVDVWSVSTDERVDARGRRVEACEPFLEETDLPPSPVQRLLRG